MKEMSDEEKRIDVRDVSKFLATFGPGYKIGYDGSRDDVAIFYNKIAGQKAKRGSFFEGKKLTDIFIYAMCLGKAEFGTLEFQKNKEGKLDIRRNIDLEYFANQPEYVWMMVAIALDETKDAEGRPTMDIFKEPRKITEICEKYANGGIGELIRISEDTGTDDLFRGYLLKLRELIQEKSK
tara:strand:+ start:57 stop:599 length:543 start_codon:yes stop_codon:yes gene_type:complete